MRIKAITIVPVGDALAAAVGGVAERRQQQRHVVVLARCVDTEHDLEYTTQADIA